MAYRNFNELIERVRGFAVKRRVAVVAAEDDHTLEAVYQAVEDDIIDAVFIGSYEKIVAILDKLGKPREEAVIIDVPDSDEAAYKAVELAHSGQADFIMKGKIETANLLKAVVDKEHGLRTDSIMSHFVIHELPGYHKLLAMTDGGMVMYPDLNQKKQIIENAVSVFNKMGYDSPKVAVLAAVEKVNPKMPETVDADALKKMNQCGEIKNCIIEGPISYDLAMSRESAAIKGFESPVTEDADILVVPNITAGNILGKCLVYSAGAKMAGFIVGAKVPVVLTSRGSSAEEKYLSLVLSAASV